MKIEWDCVLKSWYVLCDDGTERWFQKLHQLENWMDYCENQKRIHAQTASGNNERSQNEAE